MRLFRTGSESLTESLTASLTESLTASLTASLTENLAAPRGRHQRPPARKLLDAGPFCAHRYSSAAGPPAGLRLVRRAPRAPAPWMTDSGASGTRPGRPSVSGAPTARPAMAMPDAPRAPVGARAVCRSGRSRTCSHRTPGGPGTRPSAGCSHEVAEPAASGDGVRRPGSGPAAPGGRARPTAAPAPPPGAHPGAVPRPLPRRACRLLATLGPHPVHPAMPPAAPAGTSASTAPPGPAPGLPRMRGPRLNTISFQCWRPRYERIGSRTDPTPRLGSTGLSIPLLGSDWIRVGTPTDRSENETNASPPPEELMVIHECVGVAGGG